MALVIGNANYGSEVLPNARNDAESIAATLQVLDFDVSLALDVSRDRFLELLADFAQESASREASVILVYYAGHGVQLAGKNYLIPIDANINNVDTLRQQSVHFDDLLEKIGNNSSFKLVFLDACQNNPFKDHLDSLEVGLAPPPDVSGFLIGYATQPGKVAYDGAGRNSPYATALMSHMHTPGQEVLSVLARVNRHVRKDTGGAQIPYAQFSVIPEFYFLPGTQAETSVENRLWTLSAQQADPDLIKLYLNRFPEGHFVEEARSLLENQRLRPETRPEAITTAESSKLESTIWSIALASQSRSMLEYYIEHFPEGANLDHARKLVSLMPAENSQDLTAAELCRQFATHPNDATAIYPGVSLNRLARDSRAAIKACESARQIFAEDPHYKALLARAYAAAGDTELAVDLYKQAAAAGNTRALVSLGLLHELGQGVPRDLSQARSLYEQAYRNGSSDAAINLAVLLYSGDGGDRDVQRSISLLEFASSEGAARATYNLGVFAKEGIYKSPEQAVSIFELAARQGYAEGALAAAAIYDEGFHTDKSPEKASDLLLSALTVDSGETLAKITADPNSWSRATIVAVQSRLKAAGYYDGTLDGVPGPRFNRGMELWRLYGGSPA
ncbi:MAG: hypothetical protein Tsb0019_27150 [Roseibium sp.]